MSTVVKDLGAVSAYAYAVEKGYTGTEAEFAELMASYADVGQTAVDAKNAAITAKTAAQTAATTATNKASEATTAATTATNKAAEAQADADAAALDASQAMSAASTATSKATEATTAAATATSAKTDAVAANTAAQSAKTAAQTAQTGAETAAASVEASAEQIATNAEDISQLKSDLTYQLNGDMFLGSLVPNVYIATDGREITYNGWSATKYLSLEAIDALVIHSNVRSVYNAFYDSNKNFVSTFVVENGETQVVIPNNAVYFRLSNTTVAMQSTTVDGALADLFKTSEEVANIKSNLYIDDVARITHADAENESYDLAYINTSGNTVEYANSYCSDYVAVVSGGTINYRLSYIHGLSVALAFYDGAKTFISGVKKDSGSSGVWTEISGDVVVPNNATYVRFSMLKINSGTLVASNQYVELPVKAKISDVVDQVYAENTIWKNKKWCAFGTSITDTSFMNTETGEVTGKYVPYLASMSGLIVTNRGIAGGTLGSGGVSGGTSTILNRILNSSDLDDYDLITVEGFVNDFACGVAIGSVGDTENTTMYGALFQAIEHILTTSHATVVFITETTGTYYEFHTTSGTGDYRVLRKNGIGLYQQDYNNAIIDMCQRYGVPVIDAGAKSQINQYRPQFIIDQIHHTELGGKQYANTIWSELKNIPVLAKQMF